MPLTSRQHNNCHASVKQTVLQPAERMNRESGLGCSNTDAENSKLKSLSSVYMWALQAAMGGGLAGACPHTGRAQSCDRAVAVQRAVGQSGHFPWPHSQAVPPQHNRYAPHFTPPPAYHQPLLSGAALHMCVRLCFGVCRCAQAYVCLWVCVCVCVCVCMHVRVYTCLSAHVCTRSALT